MHLQASVFVATSLDGYIARENGDIDWLEAENSKIPEDEDCGFVEFMKSVDILVMGSNSFEKVLSFSAWPYDEKQVIVLSSRKIDIPKNIQNTVDVSSESPTALYERLSSHGATRLYVDGGAVIQSFLRSGLINDLTITVIPILLGSGKSLFGNLASDIHLEHQITKTYEFGFVQSMYRIK